MGKTVLDITGGSLRAKVNKKLSSIASTVKHKDAILNGIIEENTYYELGTITSAPTITAVENSYDESVIIFTVGGSESIPAFPFIPSGYKLVDIPIKEFSVGSKYVICYWNSTVIIKRLVSSTKASDETWNGYAWSDYNNRQNISTSGPGSEFDAKFEYGDPVSSNRRSTRFIYTYEGHDRLVATDYVPDQDGHVELDKGPYSSLAIWSQGTDGEITSNGGDIYLNAYMKGNNRFTTWSQGTGVYEGAYPANNYTNEGALSGIYFSNGLSGSEKTELNNNKENYNISAIRFGSIVTDFSIQSERDARYIEDFEVDKSNTVLDFDGVSLNKTVNNKKTSLFIIPSKVTVTSGVLDLSGLNIDYLDEFAIIGFTDPDNEHSFNSDITEIILPSSIKGFTSPASSHSDNIFGHYYGSFSTTSSEYSGSIEVTVKYPGTIAQATAAIDELHDSTAYNNSATNAAIPVALVCSDGSIYTQSLFNS
jgi:hypothetical protein